MFAFPLLHDGTILRPRVSCKRKFSFYSVMLMPSLQHFSIIFIIHARSFYKFIIFSSMRPKSRHLEAFPLFHNKLLLRQTISRLMETWLSSFPLVWLSRGKRMRVNIHGTRACVVCHPIWPELVVHWKLSGRSSSRRHSSILFAPQQLLRNQTWIINNSWPPLGWDFKDQS